jgi:hypothetical protein
VHGAGVLPGRRVDQHRLQAAGLGVRNPAVGATGELKLNLESRIHGGPGLTGGSISDVEARVTKMPASLSGARPRDRAAADHPAISRIALIVGTQAR